MQLRRKLTDHFRGGAITEELDSLIKTGEAAIADRNHALKIADEYGFDALEEEFEKDELARDSREKRR